MELKAKLADAAKKTVLYWQKPMPGRYMSYKEIFSLSMGGMGVKFIVFCVQNMILGVGNTLIGNTIGIEPTPLYVLYLLGMLSSFPLTALRARMIDNTRSMKGKYRPYVLMMGIPTVLLGIGFVWTPYDGMSQFTKYVVVLLFNIGFQFFYNFMLDAYDSLLNVLSPNTIERSDVYSIRAVVENFSPSIAGIFLPLAARAITGQDTLYDLKIYRVIYPPMLLAGLLLAVLVHVNTKEKIVQAKSRVIQIRFVDAFRAVARNKYFWILSLGSWLGFLEGAANNLLQWLYNYQKVCTAAQFSLITAISGNAGFWPNLIAPFLVRKIGKRNILIYTNLLNIVFLLMMYPVIMRAGSGSVIWWILLCMFINGVTTSVGHNIGPSLNADVRDYQQYVTGERIDGMFAAVGLIGNVIGIVTGFILPMIYDRAGLNQATALSLGYDGANVYDVLYNHDFFVRICGVLIIASVIGGILNVIPYFFYDLTESKQRAMVSVLKIRAYFEDYGSAAAPEEAGEEPPEALVLIEEANRFAGQSPQKPSKNEIKTARKTGGKEAVKAAKEHYKQQLADNEKIETAQYVLLELGRFNSADGQKELENARQVAGAGLQGFTQLRLGSVAEAKILPTRTPLEKELRRNTLAQARDIELARKTIAKHYPDGIEAFDSAVFDTLFTAADETALALHEAQKALLQTKNDKNPAAQNEGRIKIAALRAEKARIDRELKDAAKRSAIYNLAAKPYVSAQRLLRQAESYGQYAGQA